MNIILLVRLEKLKKRKEQFHHAKDGVERITVVCRHKFETSNCSSVQAQKQGI